MHLLQTTVADEETAVRLGRALVTEGLAACVQRSQIQSTYLWHDELVDEEEWLLRCKIGKGKLEPATARLAQLHPYDIPMIASWAMQVNGAYRDWADRPAGT